MALRTIIVSVPLMCLHLVYHFHTLVFSLRPFTRNEELGESGIFGSCTRHTLQPAQIFDNWTIKSKVILSPDPGLTIYYEHVKRDRIWIRPKPLPSLSYFTMHSLENCHPREKVCSLLDSVFHNSSSINRFFCYLSLCSVLASLS